MRKVISIVLGGLFLLVVLFSGSILTASAAEKISINMWAFPLGDDSGFFDPVIKEFEKQNPNMEIRFELQSWDNRFEMLLASVVGHTQPDLVYMNDGGQSLFADKGIFLPLEKYIPQEVWDDLLPGKKLLEWKGSVYVMPILQTATVSLYNKDAFKKVGLNPEEFPATFSEFVRAIDKLTIDADGRHPSDPQFDKKDVRQYGLAMPMAEWFIAWWWSPLFLSAGGEWVTEDGKRTLINQWPGLKATFFFKTLFDNYVDPGNKALGWRESFDKYFLSGRSPIYFQVEGPQIVRQLRKEPPGFDWGLGRVLKDVARWSHGTMAGYSIFSATEHPDEAAKWLVFLTNEKNMVGFDEYFYFLCPRASLQPKLMEKVNDPMFALFLKEAQHVVWGEPCLPEGPALNSILVPHLQNIVMGKEGVKEGLDEAAAEWNSILAGE